jgi:hypothetical protein
MFKVLIPAAAALGLVAFSARSQGGVPEVGAFAAAPAMAWSVHHEGALAKLAYGVADSDQLTLMVSCEPGDRTATIYGDVHPEAARPMLTNLQSVPLDPLSGGEAHETQIGLNDPALTALATRGRMAVRGDAGVFQLAATPEERRLVGDFLSYCSAGLA